MDNDLKAIHDVWPWLRFWQRKALAVQAIFGCLPSHPQGIAWRAPMLAVRAVFITFALLLVLPHHPLSMVIAFGGGLSFALITY